jgi:hypothetical protein
LQFALLAKDRAAKIFKAPLTSLRVAADHDLRCDLPRRVVDGVYSSLLQHRLKHTESEWERVSFIRHTAGRERERERASEREISAEGGGCRGQRRPPFENHVPGWPLVAAEASR